eukprot:gene12045-15150_t
MADAAGAQAGDCSLPQMVASCHWHLVHETAMAGAIGAQAGYYSVPQMVAACMQQLPPRKP